MEDETVEAEFDRFESWCQGKSELYRIYCERIVEDQELRKFIGEIDASNRPYMLFAAVHFLLLEDDSHGLSDYYPSVSDDPRQPGEGDPGELFSDFCLQNRDRIRELTESRKVQTNEIRRCAALLPGFAYLSRKIEGSVSMVEVGASAGLNLIWDSYRYRYHGYREIEGEEPAIECEVREGSPPLDVNLEVKERIGIDINPLDVSEKHDRRWLKALTWPEHRDRRERLEKAMNLAREQSPEIVEGDAVEDLKRVVGELEDPVIIYGTQVLWALGRDRVQDFLDTVGELQEEREIYCLFGERGGLEWLMGDRSSDEEVCLEVFEHPDDIRRLGEYEVHGEWLRWHVE